MAGERLSDDEVVYRRIRVDFLKPQNRIPPSSFKLREGKDAGISTNLTRLSDANQTVAKGEPQHNYWLAGAKIGDIRALTADDGTPLHLDVFPAPTEDDPSHVEICGPELGKLPEGAPRALARLFQTGFPITIG